MTNQQILNKVYRHLVHQGVASTGRFKNELSKGPLFCLYRGPKGRMCSIGVLIADEHYTPELETKSVEDSLVRLALFKSGIDVKGNTHFYVDLQSIHDDHMPWVNAAYPGNDASVEGIINSFLEVAINFDLEYPTLKD